MAGKPEPMFEWQPWEPGMGPRIAPVQYAHEVTRYPDGRVSIFTAYEYRLVNGR